jgi:hypothetical protein
LSDASSDQPIVAVIHSSPGTVGPANLVLTERFPEARPRHLLDSRLGEPSPAEGISAPSRELLIGLITDAIDHGADGVLLCTSSFGPVAHSVAGDLPVPVLAPDETMFAHVDALRPARVAVLGPQKAGLLDIVTRLNSYLASLDRAARTSPTETRVTGTAVLGAIGGGPAGDHESLLAAVVATARAVAEVSDLIVLEHFSLAPAAAAVQSAVSVPVLSSPHLVVDVLRGLLLETANG